MVISGMDGGLRKLARGSIVQHGCARAGFPASGRINGPFTRRPRRAAVSPMLRTQMRPALAAAAALTAALAAVLRVPAPAQEARLPDIGSSAATVISPSEQAEYGAMMLSQLRYYGYTLEDPLLLS